MLVAECAIKADGAPNVSGNINDPAWDTDAAGGPGSAGQNTDQCSFIVFDSQNIYDGHPAVGDTYLPANRPEPAFHDHDNGSLNYLAFDGHVKYLKKTAVSGAIPPPAGFVATGDNGTIAASSPSPYVLTYSVTK